MNKKILWIEGRLPDVIPLITSLRNKGYQVEIVSTGNEALGRLDVFMPAVVVVNASSMRSNGKRICGAIRKHSANLSILLVLDPSQPVTKAEYADSVLVTPFTPRKLINRIIPLLPWSRESLVQAGPIRFDEEQRRVELNGRVTRLTPSLTALLKMLIEHQGEVVPRVELFRQVWETEYTGDTRTLDVHISWLRRAIEEDPRNPIHLKTIRGVGYRLDT